GKSLGPAGPPGDYTQYFVSTLNRPAEIRLSGGPVLSPDARFVAFSRDNPPDIWVLDTEKGLTSRLTSNPSSDSFPVFSPDGKRVAFRSERDGSGNIYVRGVDEVGAETLLFKD